MELEFKGKTAKITSLHQWYTYEGLIEGLPHDRMNQRILQDLPERAMGLTDIKSHYLLEPKQTPIDFDMKYPFGTPMRLPGIICVVGLKCYSTSNPEIGGISELTLICFQDSFAPPFDPHILDKVKDLDWFSYARDISWDDF